MLHPEIPPGGTPIQRVLPAERVEVMRRHLRGFAASFGIADGEMVFSDHAPNTARALAMTEYARDEGQLHPLRHALMNAYWRRGEDIEQDEVLTAAAESVGLDAQAALQATDDFRYTQRVEQMGRHAWKEGITGIPTFRAGELTVVGCQPFEMLAKLVEAAQ